MLVNTDQFVTKRMDRGEVLAPETTALVIVDMMNLFCDAKWLSGGNMEKEKWFVAELGTIIPNIQMVLEAFRKVDALVIHVVNAKWTRDGREVVPYQRGRDYDLFDTPKMSVIEPLMPRPGEIVIRKVASSAFTGTGLEFLLRNAEVTDVVLCGQYGDGCVFYTLIQSREFGFTNYWLEDAILYSSEIDKVLFTPLVGMKWARLARVKDTATALGAST